MSYLKKFIISDAQLFSKQEVYSNDLWISPDDKWHFQFYGSVCFTSNFLCTGSILRTKNYVMHELCMTEDGWIEY